MTCCLVLPQGLPEVLEELLEVLLQCKGTVSQNELADEGVSSLSQRAFK